MGEFYQQFASGATHFRKTGAWRAHLCLSSGRFEIGNNRDNWKKQRARTKGKLFQTVVSHNQKAGR